MANAVWNGPIEVSLFDERQVSPARMDSVTQARNQGCENRLIAPLEI